ncbi:MAG: DUF2490 domain-containing protein [Bacteroidales bacterium]|nr:DUF2490 domain-containing protein [Bacteroidales bacterium]
MKYRMAILALCCALLPVCVSAQGTDNEQESAIRGRIGAQVDKKIVKGLHVALDGELRTEDNFSDVGRWQAGVSVSYKFLPFLKASVGGLYISNRNGSGEWEPRQRVYGDLMGTLKWGDWRFSLKERLQMTHREVNNKFQDVPNALALKSRIKASYKGFGAVEPYAFVELRAALNDPACTATWNGSSYTSYAFKGYSDTYLNRTRAALGVEWSLSKQHAIDFYVLNDWCRDKNIDTNKEGTKLKSLTYDRTFLTSFGIAYAFSF